MGKIGLSIYGIGVTRNGVEHVDLNTGIDGKGIIDLLFDYVESHKDQYDTDVEKERLFTFCDVKNEKVNDSNGKLIYRALSIRVKSGEYGISSELVNIKTGDVYNRTVEQADILPFGFSVLIPSGNVTSGIIVMQTMGQYGIKTALDKQIHKILQAKDKDLFLSIGAIVPRKYIENYFENGVLQKIRMTRYEIPEDEAERYGVNFGVKNTVEERIIHKPAGFMERKKKEIQEWMKGQRSSTDIVKIDGFEYDNLKFEFKLGNNSKTINLDNLDKLVITEDISDKVQVNDGHPTFDSLVPVMKTTGAAYLLGQGLISE